MKKFIIPFLIILCIATPVVYGNYHLKTVTLTVEDMEDDTCADEVAAIVENLEGVNSVEVYLETSEVIVEFYDNEIDIRDVIYAIQNAGYYCCLK